MIYNAVNPSAEIAVFDRAQRSDKGLNPVVSATSSKIAQEIVKNVLAAENARRKQELKSAVKEGALQGKRANIEGQGALQMQQAVGQLGVTAAQVASAQAAKYFDQKAKFDTALTAGPEAARKFLEANPDFDPGEAKLQQVIAGTEAPTTVPHADALAAARQAYRAKIEGRQAETARQFEAMGPQKTLIEAMASDPEMLDLLARREQEKEFQAILAANAERQFREENFPGYGDLTIGETTQPIGVADRPVLTRQGASEAQSMLTKVGYDVGGIDGIVGPKTRKAILEYQQSLGLPLTGAFDAVTMNALRMDFASVINPMSAAEQFENFDSGVQLNPQQLPPYMRPGV